jgi:hypothetical protein
MRQNESNILSKKQHFAVSLSFAPDTSSFLSGYRLCVFSFWYLLKNDEVSGAKLSDTAKCCFLDSMLLSFCLMLPLTFTQTTLYIHSNLTLQPFKPDSASFQTTLLNPFKPHSIVTQKTSRYQAQH